LYRCIFKIKAKLVEKKKEYFSKCLLDHYDIKPKFLNISPYFSLDANFKKSFIKFFKIQEESDSHKSDSYTKIEFYESILLLRGFNQYDSIIEKIDAIFKIRSCLLKEIDNFWKNIPIKSLYKIIDADNLLSIVIYLIIKSQMSELIIDLEVMDDFIDNKIKTSRKGYFFNLINSSLEYFISHFNNDQINQNIRDYEKNIQKVLNILGTNPNLILE
jgi:hypothetical protein